MDGPLDAVQQTILHNCARVNSLFRNVSRRTIQPATHLRAIALLIWLLSNNIFFAICFLQRYPAVHSFLETLHTDSQRAVLTFLEWLQDEEIYGTVLACIDNVEHILRRRADTVLMESLLVQFISWQNSRGLTVDLHQAVNSYLRLWAHRPVAGPTRQWLRRLVWHRNTCVVGEYCYAGIGFCL